MHLQNSECLADLKDKKAMAERLQKTKEYLKTPHMLVIVNTERIDISK